MLDGKASRTNCSQDDSASDISITAEALRRLNDPFALMEALAVLEVRTSRECARHNPPPRTVQRDR
jgi:hypothetical protein